MTTEAFTPPPRYTISGTGPYNIPHEYRHAIDFAPIVRSGNTWVELAVADFSIGPDTSSTQGDLTLTAAAAATYDGYYLYIIRATADEQGWVGVAGAREKGLEGQLDSLAMAIQDVRTQAGKALVVEDGPPRGVLTVLEAGRALIVNSAGDGLIPGPNADEIANAQTHAERSEAAAANAALGTPYGFPTAPELLVDERLSYIAGENKVVVAPGQYVLAGGFRHQVSEQAATTPLGYQITNAGGVKMKYVPGSEVNVLAVRMDADGDDISLTLRRAAAAFPGKLLRLPPGSYNAYTPFEVGDLSAALVRADGAVVTVMDNTALFRAEKPTFIDVQAISAVDGDDYWGARSIIEVTDGTKFSKGQLVKLVSDDKQRGTRPAFGGNDYRRGWWALVTDVVGNLVSIDAPVPWDLTSNPRIGVCPRRRFEWIGGKIQYEADHDAEIWTAIPFILYGVSDLRLDVEFGRCYNAAISMPGCYRPIVKAVGDDIENDETNNQYGYLVNDNSFAASVSVHAGRTRHGYTTNMPAIPADSDDLHLYGAIYGFRVTLQGHGQTQAHADTHHGSENGTFVAPVASGGSSGGGNMVFRGIGHRVISPKVFGGKHGIYAFNEANVQILPWKPFTAYLVGDRAKNGLYYFTCTTAGTSSGSGGPTGKGASIADNTAVWDFLDDKWNTEVEIINADVDVDQYPLRVELGAICTVRGGVFRSRKYGKAAVVGQASLILRDSVEFRPGGTTEISSNRTIELFAGSVDARGADILFDLQDIPASATNYGLVQGDGDAGDTSRWRGGTLRTINDANLKTCFYKKSGTLATIEFGGGGLKIITEKEGSNPDGVMGITGAAGVGFTGAWSWEVEGGEYGTQHIYNNVGADDVAPFWYNRADRVVNWLVFSTGTFDLGALPDGTFRGQVLIITCSATGTLTLRTGPTANTLLGADMFLSSADGVTLSWSGSSWIRAAT